MAKRKRPNSFYAILSLTLIQFLFGLFALFLITGQGLTKQLKEQVKLIIEIKPDAGEHDVPQLRAWLARKEFIIPESIEFTDKEQALQSLRDELGSDNQKTLDALGLMNPLYDMLSFSVQAEYLTETLLQDLQQEIILLDGVYDVYYQQSLVEVISMNIQRIAMLGFALTLFALILTISLITSTVRLSMFANRFLIKNMQMVGATWSFIRRPYMQRAASQSFISTLLAFALLGGLLYWVSENLGFSLHFIPLYYLAGGALAIFLFGLIITLIATRLSVNRYLRLKLDDLY
jgi:cell division transport system permease protein